MGPLAASLSYYSLFALFPLLLLLITIATPFEPTTKVISLAVGFIRAYLPTAQIALERALEEIVAARGPATIIALIALLWSESGFFNVLQLTMSRAWAVRTPRPIMLQCALSVGIVAVAALLFMVNLVHLNDNPHAPEILFFSGRRTSRVGRPGRQPDCERASFLCSLQSPPGGNDSLARCVDGSGATCRLVGSCQDLCSDITC